MSAEPLYPDAGERHPLAHEDRNLQAGQVVFGRYQLEAVAGQGAVGVVWRAQDTLLGQAVALKFLPRVIMRDDEGLGDLKRETRRSRELTHPHIVRVHDLAQDSLMAAISMEFVNGETLARKKQRQPQHCFTPARIWPWMRQLAEALDYAHRKARIVHRDLKPANLMIDLDGDLKVVDFGIARSLSDAHTRLTLIAPGLSGSLAYMSPQQLLGKPPAPEDDIYALGAMIYELLTGKPPFHRGDLATQVQQTVPPTLAERRAELASTGVNLPPIPAAWETVVAACLAKDPAIRPTSAGEAVRRMEEADPVKPAKVTTTRGGILVRTQPAGADVSLGGLEKQKSPLALKDVKVGRYPIKIQLEGYESHGAEVEVRENAFAEVNVTLKRSLGSLVLTSAASGVEAEVSEPKASPNGAPAVAGRKVALPADLKLPTGRYNVTFRKAGWPDLQQTADIHRETVTVAEAEFAGSQLELTSTPSGAEVWSHGRQLGKTPLHLDQLFPSLQNWELRLKGHIVQVVGGELVARETLHLHVELPKTPEPEVGESWTIPGLNLELLPIETGSFEMGSVRGGYSNERPATWVRISRPYWLGRTPITQEQWQTVMGANPSVQKGADLPVENVSWSDAVLFCRKLTEAGRNSGKLAAGYAYRLPTEAEWEYACRSGTTGDYAGNGRLDDMGWYEANSGGLTKPVAQKLPNAWGLHDMHGNVWEWCSDWYGIYPGGSVEDPTGPGSGSFRVYRGGCWSSFGRCRSAFRDAETPGFRSGSVGFRIALGAAR